MTNMHTVKSFCAAAALAALLVASPVSSQDAVERSVLIGLVNNNEPGFRAEVLTPTLDYLKKTLPNISFRTVDIAAYKAVDDLFRTRPDFVIAPSDVFVTLSSSISAHPLGLYAKAVLPKTPIDLWVRLSLRSKRELTSITLQI